MRLSPPGVPPALARRILVLPIAALKRESALVEVAHAERFARDAAELVREVRLHLLRAAAWTSRVRARLHAAR